MARLRGQFPAEEALCAFSLVLPWERDDAFTESLQKNMEENKNKTKNTFWPTDRWVQDFSKTYNLRYKKQYKTLYEKTNTFNQIHASLVLMRVVQKIFKVPVSVGKIFNADETLTYSFVDSAKKMDHLM